MSEIIKNIGWLIFDKVFILILQFFIGVKIANHYGSELYGIYSYITAIVSFSSIFFELINGRVIKKYYTEENYDNVIYNVTFFRNVIATCIFFIAILTKFVINIDNFSYFILVLLTLDSILSTMTIGIENYFEYKLESRKIVISNNIVIVFSYVLQYIGVLLGYSMILLPLVRCIGTLIKITILKFLYKKSYGIKTKNKIDKEMIFGMIKDSFYLWASFVAFLIYIQIDKIMIGSMIGKKEVGIYAIGIQLSTILAIMLGPIQTSIFPKMLSLYNEDRTKYYSFYIRINYYITQMYVWGSIISIFVLNYIFKYVFSSEYNDAVVVYAILTIGILAKANGALQTSHMTIKEITQKSFYKTTLGLFINIILNYVLIKKYGIIGSAFASSITHMFTLFIIDFFIKEYREQAFIQLKSFNPFLYFWLKKV